MSAATLNESDGTNSYVILRRRFECKVAAGVDPTAPPAEVLAATIRSALAVADAEPSVALRLTLPASGRRTPDLLAFTAAVDDLVARLRQGPIAAFRSERAARNFVLRVARQVCLRLEASPGEPVSAIGPDLIVLALTSCVGLGEARRLADQPSGTS